MISEICETQLSIEESESLAAPFGFEVPDTSTSDGVVRVERIPHVCICGHSLGSHHSTSAGGFCINGKLWCPCETPYPVLEVLDLRDFHFRTSGWGDLHALTLGTFKSIRNGRKVRQLIENKCFKCAQQSERLIATSLSIDYFVLEECGPRNALLCPDCWSKYPVRYFK